ncbi:DUF2058 family protein [Pseudoalteromonas lipolytica]|nr:DUF2058 family protein [Pseudoalteromonas lipolytica]
MSNAFRDQLLKAGLADAKKVKKVKKSKNNRLHSCVFMVD